MYFQKISLEIKNLIETFVLLNKILLYGSTFSLKNKIKINLSSKVAPGVISFDRLKTRKRKDATFCYL